MTEAQQQRLRKDCGKRGSASEDQAWGTQTDKGRPAKETEKGCSFWWKENPENGMPWKPRERRKCFQEGVIVVMYVAFVVA